MKRIVFKQIDKLTDGSKVYNVVIVGDLDTDVGRIVLLKCDSEKTADEIIEFIENKYDSGRILEAV